jgi:hypothetical protein
MALNLKILQVVIYLDRDSRGNTAVEHLTHHPKVEGSSPGPGGERKLNL